MNKYLIIGLAVGLVALIAFTASIVIGVNYTGFFKAFDKTLSPGEYYERNITVRKFYNVSIRFQKENSSSYLGFDGEDSVIVLKDYSGSEIVKVVGVKNGRAYLEMTNYEMASVATISAYNISDYADVINQPVNDSVLSFSGTKAYITVKVTYAPAVIAGYVIDDLTGEFVSGVTVAAFENDAYPAVISPINQNTSDSNGRYKMIFNLDSSNALDVYIKDYDVV